MAKKKTVKQKLIDATVTLLAKKSYSDISITELAKEANVSRISFYRNYDSFETLAKDTYTSLFKKNEEFLSALFKIDNREELKEYCTKNFAYFTNFTSTYTPVFISNLLASSPVFLNTYIKKMHEENDFRSFYAEYSKIWVVFAFITEYLSGRVEEAELDETIDIMIDIIQHINFYIKD